MSTPHICPTCQCEGSHASMLACVEALQRALDAESKLVNDTREALFAIKRLFFSAYGQACDVIRDATKVTP